MSTAAKLQDRPDQPHPEQQYLDLLEKVWTEGDERRDRTGVGTRSIFGATVRYSLEHDSVPLLTTKKVAWKTAAREMLWFLTGDSNIRALVEQKVHIWTDWPLDKYRKATGAEISRDQFEARIIADPEFAAQWGDLGPVYGVQWTRWPKYVEAGDGLYRRDPEGVNQIANLIKSLTTNPASRRHIFTGWNVPELDGMALPPCHMNYQFYVAGNQLSCILYQRSCDLGLGYAFNVFSAALLTRMIAQQCDLVAHELIWNGGDVHVYLNHEHLVTEQLTRKPAGDPKLRILRKPATIFDYRIEDFAVEDYAPQAHIAAPVAV
ncbi:MAG: thymidylate synthase [Alphaproteobacteria bacterium]|nr:MAG: thymidylate synthase [Alphaproteobacteria bacterium]